MNARALAAAAREPLRLQAGGTLNPRRHLYIERPEDATLLQLLSEGQYVNVLTSRQMGKSSLMVRTAEALIERGVRCTIVDLAAELGTPQDADMYFLGLLNKIARDLKIEIELAAWWAERTDETMNQRLMRFFREVVLEQVPGPVGCFLDEIDSTLKLPWTDDLFTALRGMHNERPLFPAYERLTFCLIGVAWPNELIKDRRTTPYNVGRTLELRDFDLERDDLTPLAMALAADPTAGRAVVKRVLYWTGGHPYLTTRLCSSLVEIDAKAPEDVDRRVEESFRSLERVSGEVHFQQVLRFLETRLADGLATFTLYEKILKGARERDQTTLAHTELKLSGLVKRNEDGCLVVRNRIYERLFDRRWVESTRPKRRFQAYRRWAIAASIALFTISMLSATAIWIQLQTEKQLSELIISANEAELLEGKGRYDEAALLYERAFQSSRETLGEANPQTLTTATNLARIYAGQGRFAEAEALYRQALRFSREELGPEHADTIQMLSNLGMLYVQQGRFADAEHLYVQALELSLRVLGDTDPQTLMLLSNLANIHASQGRFAEAERLYLQALESSRDVYGSGHPATIDTFIKLGALYTQQGRFSDAEQLYEQALQLSREVFGETNPQTIMVLSNLAGIRASQGHFAEAERLHRQGLQSSRAVFGLSHPNTIHILISLGALYVEQGRFADAEPLYEQALQLSREVFGETHPQTIATRNDLKRLYESLERHRGVAEELKREQQND